MKAAIVTKPYIYLDIEQGIYVAQLSQRLIDVDAWWNHCIFSTTYLHPGMVIGVKVVRK